MNKKITKLMAALALLLFMTPAMKVIAMDDGYTIGTTPLSSVSNGDLVVWGTSNSNLAKSCSSNWIYLSSTQSEWIVFTVETTTNGFYLKTPEGSYVYSSAAKKVEFSSTNKTVLTINSNNLVNGGSSIGNYTYNSTGIRPYASNNYTNAYLYAVTPSGSIPTTYTVTYHANVAGVSDIEVEYNEGATVTIADNTFSNPGYTFTEWNTEADGNGNSYAPGDEIEDIDDNFEFYAQWEESSEITATITKAKLELSGTSYSSGEKTIDGITYTYANLMPSGNNIQVQANNGTIKNSTPYPGDIISVVITHSGTARATTINGSMDGTNWTQVATGSGSITADFSGMGYKYFQITRGSNAAYWEKIDIIYSAHASTQSESDLAITNASTDFTFDLYNNSTAQVINYTTSSTGAITITPASPTSYFSYVHDATAKTITVTPLAVTSSAQTVTISQEADENYYPGTASFTVSVDDSTPLANIAALTAQTEAGNYNVALSNAVVTYVNGNYAYIQDASGAVVMYKSGHGLTAGDVLNGTATVAYQLRNNNPQITSISGVTPVSGTAPNPTEVAISSWNYTFNNVLSQYFKVTGATITSNNNKYYISLGGENVQLYKVGTAISGLDLTKTYTIIGFPTLYNTTKELQIFADPEAEASTTPSVFVTNATLSVLAAGANGSIEVTYENIDENDIDPEARFFAEDGTTAASYNWITISFDANNDVLYQVAANNGEARTAYFKVYEQSEGVYSNLVTVTQNAYVPTPSGDNYVRITSLDQLTDGSFVVIAARHNSTANSYYALPSTATFPTRPEGVQFNSTTTDGNELLPSTMEGYYWVVNVTDNGYTFTAPDGKILGCRSKQTELHTAIPRDPYWTIERLTSGNSAMVSGYEGFVIKNTVTTSKGIALQSGDNEFGAYSYDANSNSSTYNFYLDFFVQSGEPTPEFIPLDIEAWNTTNNGGWYLITSPLAEPTDPTDVTNMIPQNLSNVDLYRFDQTASLEWINYKKEENGNVVVNNAFGNLIAGHGYLYANANDVQLKFYGTPYSGNNCQVDLDYSTANGDSNMHGWNLVGNPFTVEATIGDWDYMRMNSDHNEIILYDPVEPVNIAVAPMEGIFVHATEEGQSVTFTPSETKATRLVERTIINLTLNDNVVDRAIIRYGSGSPMPKIQLNENNTKIYFAMEDDAYAVVVCDNQDQLALNFMAATSGTYTLSFIHQNAEFDYLHLIDNKTNTETDLLVNPNYTFSAQTTDDEARFIVVYERAYIGKDIIGYGESEDRDHYYLIASPIGEVDPDRVGDIFTYEHDLYYFDQDASDGLEWINIKDGNTNLMPGTGYLYASEQDVTLKFYGSAYNGEGEVTLAKDATNNPEGGFEGWNLVGNPFAQTAYIDRDFYVMREDGAEIILSERDSIGAMEGVFVNAVEDGEVMTFSTSPVQEKGQVVLNVTKGRGTTVDRAFVRFGEGQQLPKIQLFKNNTKLYIPVDGQDYAVARGEEIGEMPVSFKAESNDIYTLNLSKDNVEFAYLHLIDNMTGNDVDLLQTPSYSFEAKTTDYANRFKLVFATGNSSSDTFAFFSNGSFVINNEGNATLQVIDITGRIIKSESINGCANVNVNATTGVYMLRLVNGDNVKVQKVVVR